MVLVLEYCILDLAVLLRKARHLQAGTEPTEANVTEHSPAQKQQQSQEPTVEQREPTAGEDPTAFTVAHDHRADSEAAANPQGSSKAGAVPKVLHVLPEAFIKGIIHQVLMGVAACHSVGE